MSAIYNTEPQPTGSVIIHTTQGELSVELWAKQTPLTCRNFLQHALDGYYDNTIFHRLIPGFILQGGDPSGTGDGGESIYDNGAFSGEFEAWPEEQRTGANAGKHGVGFKDEFHSRLKFLKKGLLGMGNEGKPNTNGSQFFFTLDKTEELNNKNTLFGRIVGDTIYNLIKMSEADLIERTNKPMYPAKITHIEILINPFDNMVKRTKQVDIPVQKTILVDRKKKRKGGRKLLSFGDEEGDEEETLPLPKKKKFDIRIVMDVDEEESALTSTTKKSKSESKKPEKFKDALKKERHPKPEPESTKSTKSTEPKKSEPTVIDVNDLSLPPSPKEPTALEKARTELAALKASIRNEHTLGQPTEKETKKSALESMIPEKSVKGRRRRPGGEGISERQERQALDFLKNFQKKLYSAPVDSKGEAPVVPTVKTSGEVKKGDEEAETCDLHYIPNCQSCKAWDKQDEAEESDDEGWMGHVLSFAADKLGKDLSYRKKAEEELIVTDPLAKAKNIREEKRAERDRRGEGRKGRSWDERKNAGRWAK